MVGLKMLNELLYHFGSKSSLTPEDEELIMNLSVAYLKKRQEYKEEGQQEAKQEFYRQVVMNGLREGASLELIAKILGLPIEQIEALRDRV
jgi:hypothetical protein